jgi:hypothetical protein
MFNKRLTSGKLPISDLCNIQRLVSLCTPPFVTPCIFENNVDEGTGDEMEKRCINLEIHLVDTIDECGIHNTNDESFHNNIRYRAIHLVYTTKKKSDIIVDGERKRKIHCS